MIRLAHAVPEAFGSRLPLSVPEAADTVADTWFPAALAAAAAGRAGPNRSSRASAPDAAGRGPAPGGTPAAPSVLSWEGVSVEFDGVRAVDDVSLTVREGEWVALIGANGSGKSTMTGMTVGLGTPSAGVVRFRGRPVRPGKVFDHAARSSRRSCCPATWGSPSPRRSRS